MSSSVFTSQTQKNQPNEQNEYPKITMWVSPCRTGSSAMLKAVGFGGTHSVYQKLKSKIRRGLEEGTDSPTTLHFPEGVDHIYLKETLGPFRKEETFNPLQVLIDAGVPTSKIQLIIAKRDPLATAASWVREFSHSQTPDALVNNMIDAYNTVDEINDLAKKYGIPVTSFAYELLRDFPPEQVVEKLFSRLGLPLSPRVFEDWATLPKMGEEGSNITYSEEPVKYLGDPDPSKSIHRKAESSHGLTYFSPDPSEIMRKLGQRNINKIVQSGIIEKYQPILTESQIHLGLTEISRKESYKEISKQVVPGSKERR